MTDPKEQEYWLLGLAQSDFNYTGYFVWEYNADVHKGRLADYSSKEIRVLLFSTPITKAEYTRLAKKYRVGGK